jgi:putative nucleotidyltransferase with HDIG domain
MGKGRTDPRRYSEGVKISRPGGEGTDGPKRSQPSSRTAAKPERPAGRHDDVGARMRAAREAAAFSEIAAAAPVIRRPSRRATAAPQRSATRVEPLASSQTHAPEAKDKLRRAAATCGGLAFVVALAGLFLWLAQGDKTTGFGHRFVPMAPTTAILLTIVSLSALQRLLYRSNATLQRLVTVLSGIVMAVAVWIFAARISGRILSLEHLLAPHHASTAGPLRGIMSPVTAMLIAITCAALLLAVFSDGWPLKHALRMLLAASVFLAGLIVVVGYAYDTPFLYGAKTIPVSLTAGVAFAFLGLCLTGSLQTDRWPLTHVVSPTIRDRLLRVFLPLVVAIVIVVGVFEERLPQSGNPAQNALLAAVASGAIMALIVVRLAARIGGQADRTVSRHAIVADDATALAAELAVGAGQLQRALTSTVAALGATVELRDPYTAGHQRRVAELSCAIAVELGWDEAQIEALRTAALLHDIGKIVVPAEILSKPGRLSSNEMQLIRQHAQAGADTISEIEFGSAIAVMVAQHHERLDGSGYPAGLVDGQILPEARLLAVADVVEAMISHRPYRAALPVAAAVAELEDGAGSRYDAPACAAAIRLLGEKGFTFAE